MTIYLKKKGSLLCRKTLSGAHLMTDTSKPYNVRAPRNNHKELYVTVDNYYQIFSAIIKDGA